MIKYVTFLVAACGLALAIYTVSTGDQAPPKFEPAAPPSINPFTNGIAATGLVEAASRNIEIAAPEGGLVTRVFVDAGASVKAGDPLFELDPRPLQAQLAQLEASLVVARAELALVEARPRAEEIPPLEAAVRVNELIVADLRDQLERTTTAVGGAAASQSELLRLRFATSAAEQRLEQNRAELALTRAGAWKPEVAVRAAAVARAEADVKATKILLDRRTVRSPIDGVVLKRIIEPGQFAAAASGAASASMYVGDIATLNVRAQVDEEDLPVLRLNAAAMARARGPINFDVPLKMLRIEPLAAPKQQLSGATQERVDTRVLEVIFAAEPPPGVTIYAGQLVDVFIETAPRQ